MSLARLGGRLRALEIGEERRLAGMVAGLLYLIGAGTACLLLVLPGVDTSRPGVLLALAGLGALWGVACLTVIPWERAHPIVSHLSSSLGLPITVAAMAVTGGASSPARFYMLFIVVYCSWFYRPREAVPYVLAAIVVLAVPFAYDDGAVDRGLLAELIVLTPTFLVLGGLIMAGKQVLVELSRHDALTGLLNRRAFAQHLQLHRDARRGSDSLVLVLVDLDGFKEANTVYGYPQGDKVLRRTAKALEAAVRADDLVARLGGDEFAIVMRGASEADAEALAGRVRRELERAGEALDLPDFRLSASLGWALYPRDAVTLSELVAVADNALRGAKAAGKDRSQAPHQDLFESPV